MAVAMGTAMAVMTGIQLAGTLGSAVFSWIRSRKAAKQAKAQAKYMQAQTAMMQQQTMGMVHNMQAMNGGAIGGLTSGYLSPMGFTQPGAGYGPAPSGYFPPRFA